MYTLTTISDLTNDIAARVGDTADLAICERVAYGVWGDSRQGDEIELPGDLTALYLEAESVHDELLAGDI